MEDEFVTKALERAQTLTQKVPEALRAAAFGIVLDALLRPARATPGPTPAQAEPSGVAAKGPVEDNLNEFLARVQPKSHPARVVAIAYHSLRTGDQASVTTADLADAYGRVRQRMPKNISDVIAKCVKPGLLIEAPQKKDGAKAWIITPTGEAYVESGFQEA